MSSAVLGPIPVPAERAAAVVDRRGERERRPGAELADVGIANLDPDLRVLEANGSFLYQFGRSAAEVCGQEFRELVHASVEQVVVQQLTRLGENRRDRFTARLVGLRPNDGVFFGDLTAIAVRPDNGQVSKIVLLTRPDRPADPQRTPSGKRKALSEIDARVLEGVAAGNTTVQLAAKLFLSRQGIEYHVAAMLRRFKSPNRSALVAKAYSEGILRIGQWPPQVTPDYVS
ncbi:LuxR C-terminal-related transcriptional regulator [Actinokineospora auranticolor]|uniref:PAS domain S-box-containing protein n=1 Tax=Actinokineospora auranticolor TaxID=155976 RepID=A0A2S6GTD6_9PSEU|nr:LuxR C-terminal-related transcriptional regulator [Actinokineospora auranticolor]PPK68515.1 PAS domain S-box-containing protein [Actinokineospora auranticolor]